MTDLYEQERQGSEAESILESPLIQSWFQEIDQHLISTLKATKLTDAEGREKIHCLMWSVERLRIHMQTTIDTGKFASEALKPMRKPIKEVLQEWIGL